MTAKKPTPPPFPDGPIPDWAHDTPRPTSPPPPRHRRRAPIGTDSSLAREGLRALRRAVQDFRLAGMSNADITRALAVLLMDSWDEQP